MRAVDDTVNASVEKQRINFGEKRIEEISAKPGRLPLVETVTFNQISFRVVEEFNPHDTRRRMSAFASSQFEKCASPDVIRRSRSSSTSPC